MEHVEGTNPKKLKLLIYCYLCLNHTGSSQQVHICFKFLVDVNNRLWDNEDATLRTDDFEDMRL